MSANHINGAMDYHYFLCSTYDDRFNFESNIHDLYTNFSFMTLYIFQGYMQWKYDRKAKEYIISFGIVPLLIITGFMLNVFYNTYW